MGVASQLAYVNARTCIIRMRAWLCEVVYDMRLCLHTRARPHARTHHAKTTLVCRTDTHPGLSTTRAPSGFKQWLLKERLPLPTSGAIRESLTQMEQMANDKMMEHLQAFEMQLQYAY